MKRIAFLSLVTIFIVTWSCNRNSQNEETKPVEQEPQVSGLTNSETLSSGFQLLETNCFSCHSPDAGHDSRVAPPMMAIKKHYVTEGTSQEEFTNDLVAFIQDPRAENTRLKHAVEKFGVMPKMDFDQNQLKAIAAYIYHAEFEKPGWYKQHYAQEKKKHMQHQADESFLEKGRKLAMQTKGILGKNLLAALKEQGPEGAVEFCSTRAISLTDSMALALNAGIKRVSDNNRNPVNSPTSEELAYIQQAKIQLLEEGKIDPVMQEKDGRMLGYYPIITNQMCLQCHGKKGIDINSETQELLDKLYPLDKATGYDENQLRGIWVVEMDKG